MSEFLAVIVIGMNNALLALDLFINTLTVFGSVSKSKKGERTDRRQKGHNRKKHSALPSLNLNAKNYQTKAQYTEKTYDTPMRLTWQPRVFHCFDKNIQRHED